jgi:hypothetical protein
LTSSPKPVCLARAQEARVDTGLTKVSDRGVWNHKSAAFHEERVGAKSLDPRASPLNEIRGEKMPVKSYPKGARKALRAMQKTYGAKKGKQVFYARARKIGGKGSLRKAVSKTYSKKSKSRARISRRKRRR